MHELLKFPIQFHLLIELFQQFLLAFFQQFLSEFRTLQVG